MPLVILIAVAAFLLYLKQRASGSAATVQQVGGMASVPAPGASNALDNFGQAIFQMEGGQPGNLNVRNNNPGNLVSGPNMTGTSGGYAVFADSGDGWDALNGLITKRAAANPSWDFYDFFNYYLRGSTTAPSVDAQGNSDAYAEYVANYLGVNPTDSVFDTLNAG